MRGKTVRVFYIDLFKADNAIRWPKLLSIAVVTSVVARLVEALRYKPGRSRVPFPMVLLEFFIFPAALWPWG